MPKFTIPLGKSSYDVDAADPMEALQKAKQLDASQQPPPDAPLTDSSITGGLKSLITGGRNFVEGAIAAPGNLITAEADLADKYLPKIGERTWRQRIDQPTHSLGVGDVATSPEVTAAADSAVSSVLPQGGVDAVKDITQHEAHGLPEEYAQTAGEFLPMLLSPGSWPAKAAAWLGAAGTTETAGQAARQVAPDYEDAVRLVTGFLTGAGGVKGGAGRSNFVARRAMKKLTDAGPEAIKQVQERLIADGMTPEQAAARMRELGPAATPMDVGANLRQEGQQTMARGGPGRTILDESLRGREAGANERLQPDIRANVGPAVDRLQTLQALKDRANEVGEKYPDVKKAQPGGPTELQAIDDRLASEMAVVKDNELLGTLDDIRKSLKVRGTGEMDPSSEGLHAAREAIDNKLYKPDGSPRDMGGKQGTMLKRYRALIDKELARVAPDIKALDEQYSGIKKEEEAFGTGEEMLDKGRATLSPSEFQRSYDAMSPGQKTAVRQGMTREIDRLTGVNINDRVKLKNLISGDDPASWNFAKIKTVIGDEKATALMKALDREGVFSETYQKVIQGSKTAESLPSQGGKRGLGKAVIDAAPDVGATALVSPTAAAGVGLSHLKSWIAERLGARGPNGMNPEVSAQVAKLLTSNRPDDLVQLAKLLQGSGNPTTPNVLRALMDRQADVSERKDRR